MQRKKLPKSFGLPKTASVRYASADYNPLEMEMIGSLSGNLISPLTLAFVLGMVATIVRSDLEFPEPVLKAIGIYLLFSIGLSGGVGISQIPLSEFVLPFLLTLFFIICMPCWLYLILRHLGKLDIYNAAGVTALYASVSSVTFITAIAYAEELGTPAESYLPTITSLMELGILVSMFIARYALGKRSSKTLGTLTIVSDTLRGRSFLLLIGGLVIGYLIGPSGYETISPVFKDMFRGVLVLFLLEMGMVAARHLKEFVKVGRFMLVFGMVIPLLHGVLAAYLATLAGFSVGGAFVFASIVASSSYIDAPAVVRETLPKANPSIYLTSSLGITLPFNLIVGLPLYYELAVWFAKVA